jgi:hypothetical protein
VISADGYSMPVLAAVRAGHNLGLPSIWGQHGGFYGYGKFPIYDFTAKLHTHFFLYGENVQYIAGVKPSYVLENSDIRQLYRKNRRAD